MNETNESTPSSTSRGGRIFKPTTPYSPLISTPIQRSNSIPSTSNLNSSYTNNNNNNNNNNPNPLSYLNRPSSISSSSNLNPNVNRGGPGGGGLPKQSPLSTTESPVQPLTLISNSRYQSLYTTYPSRLRLGTTSLIQPNFLNPSSNAGNNGSNTPGRLGGDGGGLGKRNRISYNDDLDDDDFNTTEKSRRISSANNAMVPKRLLGLNSNLGSNLNPNSSSNGLGGSGGSNGGIGGGDKVWGDGKSYIGVPPPGNLVIVQPAKPAKHVYCSEDQLEEQALEESLLVPIVIDLDVDSFKIRDAFVWNVNEKLITPEQFSQIFCDDLDLPHIYIKEVTKQIKEQIEESISIISIPINTNEEQLLGVEKDLRVVLNIDVLIGTLHLTDKLEWDLSSPLLTPELYSLVLTRDLSLSSSAAPLISHAIHSELLKHKKTLIELGMIGGGNEKRGAGAGRGLEGVWRDWNESGGFGVDVRVLSLDEMDRLEEGRERASRVAKRDRMTSSRRRR